MNNTHWTTIARCLGIVGEMAVNDGLCGDPECVNCGTMIEEIESAMDAVYKESGIEYDLTNVDTVN